MFGFTISARPLTSGLLATIRFTFRTFALSHFLPSALGALRVPCVYLIAFVIQTFHFFAACAACPTHQATVTIVSLHFIRENPC